MYEEFLRDPAAVGPEWRRLFESGVVGERNGTEAGQQGSGDAGKQGGNSTPVGSGATATTAPPTGGPAALPASPPPPPPASQPIKGPAAKLVANMTESLTVPTATTFRVLPVAMLEERRRAL